MPETRAVRHRDAVRSRAKCARGSSGSAESSSSTTSRWMPTRCSACAAAHRPARRAGAGRGRPGRRGRLAGTRLHRRRLRRPRDRCADGLLDVRVRGVVQGVGFRPFVFRLARAHALTGWVLNADDGVEIHLEGPDAALDAFLRDLANDPPPAAVDRRRSTSRRRRSQGFRDFTIRASARADAPTARISPDLAVCEDCLRELFDPRRPRAPATRTSTAPTAGRATRSSTSLPYDRAQHHDARRGRCVRPVRAAVSRSRPTGASTRSRSPARACGPRVLAARRRRTHAGPATTSIRFAAPRRSAGAGRDRRRSRVSAAITWPATRATPRRCVACCASASSARNSRSR